MRIAHLLLWIALALPLAAPAGAGEDAGRSDGPPTPGFDRRDGRDNGGYLDRFIRHLAQGDEAEYRRLRDLQQEDPAGFKRMLAERRDRLRTDRALQELCRFTAVREAIESMSPDQHAAFRQRLADLMADAPPPAPDGRRGGWRPREEDRQDSDIRTLTREYRTAAEADKAAVLQELRRQLEIQFDKGEADRARMIEAIERRLDGLRRTLEDRAQSREEIINCRLEEVLDEPVPPKPDPR